MTITETIVIGVALISLAGAALAALRYARRLGRSEAERKHAEARDAAKDRADAELRKPPVHRTTVVDRLRKRSF